MKSARTWPLMAGRGLYKMLWPPSSMAHFANLPDVSGFCSIVPMWKFVSTVITCPVKYRRSLREA
ncbi:hypothetical protein Hanom_Chr14g01315311 [Helianthus anomalus]